MKIACGTATAYLFEPRSEGELDWFYDQRVRSARSLCNSCPLLTPCGRQGVEDRETGIWGGLVLIDGKVKRKAATKRRAA